MEERKKRCCTASNCPCYPNCDQMMSENWKPEVRQLNQQPGDLMKLAQQDEEDLARLKELYPARIRQILTEVEAVCDSMEYEGSIMFDEMPEKQRILDLTAGIQGKMDSWKKEWEEAALKEPEEDIYVMDHRLDPTEMQSSQSGRSPMTPGSQPWGAPPPGSQPWGPPPQPRPRQVNWFGDLVQVLLQDEMYHRRCRRRNCRNW